MKIIILLLKNPKLFAKKIFGGILKLFKIYISKDVFKINVRNWKNHPQASQQEVYQALL